MAEPLVVIGGEQRMVLPALFAPDAQTAERVIEFLPRAFATRTPARPMRGRRADLRPGVRNRESGPWARCDPSMSRPISRGYKKESRRPRSSCNSLT